MTNRQIFENTADALHLPQVSQREFYRTIYPEGALSKTGVQETGWYTALIELYDKSKREYNANKFIYLHDDLNALPNLMAAAQSRTNGIAYAGKSGEDSLARELYALIFRVNLPQSLGYHTFGDFCCRHMRKSKTARRPRIAPTFVTLSGDTKQVLFYYVLEEPIPMYNKFLNKLKSMHTYLSRAIHVALNEECYDSVAIPRQYGIYARYPVVGTMSGGDEVIAYKTGEKYTLDDINALLPKTKRLAYHQATESLEHAQALWPDWARRRLVQKRKPSGKRFWIAKPNLFAWYVDLVEENKEIVKPGILEALMSYAAKSGAYHKKVWDTARHFQDILATRYPKSEIDSHVADAWGLYDNPSLLRNWTISHIEDITGLTIPRNKRNGRTQAEHLALLHQAQSKEDAVRQWRLENPEGTKSACAQALHITWDTANKWWDAKAKKADKPAKVPVQTLPNKCPIVVCNGILVENGYQQWYSEKNGLHYKRKVCACDCCGTVSFGKARIAD